MHIDIDDLARVAAFVTGLTIVYGVLGSAVRTVVLPRGVSTRIGRAVFVGLRVVFRLVIRPRTSYARRDRVLAAYAPLALLALLFVWLLGTLGGFTAMFWAWGAGGLRQAFLLAGSSMLTLGFAIPKNLPEAVLAFADAGIGLLLLALLITFLPTIYASFQARESAVARLEVRAGAPPAGATMLARLGRLERLDYRTAVWIEWEQWFVAVEQSHTQFPALIFFRSPQPDQSWVTAAGAVLDAAALATACLAGPPDLEAQLCIRAGYLALRRIAGLLRLPYPSDPAADSPIAVTRGEFDSAWEQLRDADVALRADRDQAWRDFAGWRVNYETVLIRLATITEAPMAPWSSDRGLVGGHRLTFIERIRL